MCFVCACTYVRSYPAAIVYLRVNTCNIQCWVVSDNLFAELLVSLLFIAIPTPLVKFKVL